jgi:hypothetical protein
MSSPKKRTAPGLRGTGAAKLRLLGSYRVFRFPQPRRAVRAVYAVLVSLETKTWAATIASPH